ncbi:hypothetical protein OG455_33040 [Kitasatospora sp. NBC_01287]|uniref:hypothetical protein n=1 Tax=Kitasatospora sp. NBC_01287 TaxID=2903573 RepID=UPI00224E9346|nr:hypothetical protein [Kitasatospora sp. NBC_01287]MCX4750286.1 hypothetical protein [Kitasatospora sp. NBC_01287]
MVGVLIEMRTVIMRKQAQGKRIWGTLAMVLFITFLAFGSFSAGLVHYARPGAGADVLATLSFGWLLGWVTGPVLAGDDSTLRLDYFKLLPIPARKLANAMLGAAFANVSLVFSLLAFAGLIAYGAQSGAAAALVGVAAVLLQLALAVVASTVAIGVMGPTISSRRGRDFGSMLVALVITGLSLASAVVPLIAKKLTSGNSPVLAHTVRLLPSGWGAVAVDAAGRSDWAVVALSLGGLVLLIGALVLVWPPLLRRRLTLSVKGKSTKAPRSSRKAGKPILPSTPLGAVIGKELRLYSRSMLRSLQLMIAFLVGVLACVIPSLGGTTIMLPFAGLLFTVIAAACFTNLYGDDGSALWLTLVTPRVERADVRGRQWAWFLVVGPVGLLLTVVLTAISGQHWAWPWVLAAEPALVAGATGVLVLVSVLTMFPLSADGGPTPPRQVKVNLMLIALPVITLLPAAALLIAGTAAGVGALEWLAVPVGIGWGALLCWWLGRVAQQRLETRGPELFSLVRRPAT